MIIKKVILWIILKSLLRFRYNTKIFTKKPIIITYIIFSNVVTLMFYSLIALKLLKLL